MPIYDHECVQCGAITESIRKVNDAVITCPVCGANAHLIISCGRVYTSNEDAAWIQSVREVVEKNSDKPHANEFLKNPTRTNLKIWMDKENLRHLEPGEGDRDPTPWRPDRKFEEKMLQRHQERNAITLYR